jgi:hypothetical protein
MALVADECGPGEQEIGSYSRSWRRGANGAEEMIVGLRVSNTIRSLRPFLAKTTGG